ncbi:MAG: right-handed parallel beta-helix repeat-containing protein [Clostridia bacterium]|nr:right-handed parallel beta-helix repeat-containing protein [Clostridia bacterium]
MRNKIIVLLISLFAVLLAGCGSGKTQPGKDDPDVRLPTDNRYVGITKLGVSVDTAVSDNPGVADAVVNDAGDTVIIRAFAPGRARLVFRDFAGHEAAASVSVNGENRISDFSIDAFPGEKGIADVRLFGATGNGGTNDTSAIQSAIDSLGVDGGTVYIPAGRYRIDRLILRDNVSIIMQGDLGDARDGFTAELSERIERGDFAVLVDNLTVNNLIINHNPAGSGRNGAGNILIRGGVVDLNGATVSGKQIDTEMAGPAENGGRGDTCACVFSCASGLTVEGVIFRDSYNGHGFQIAGAEDVIIRNCLFAGFTVHANSAGSISDLTLTRETIQIEYAHSGAIPPSTFRDGEYYHCKNVEITGCCFTKSDRAGYIMIPIGQHGMNGAPNCTGLKIKDNVFDNPFLYGIHLLSYENVEITGNRFISSKKNFGYSDTDCVFILCNLNTPGQTYSGKTKQGEDVTVTYCNPWENRGTHNVLIENNEFSITGNSFFRVLSAIGTRYAVGAAGVEGQIRQEKETLLGVAYTGFLPVQNVIDGFSFVNNDVNLGGKPAGGHNLIEIANVRNLVFSGNELKGYDRFSRSYEGFQGAVVGMITNGQDAVKRTVSTSLKNRFVILKTPDGDIRINSDGSERKIILLAPEGTEQINVDYDKRGNCIITVRPEKGKSFSGWVDERGNPFTEDASLRSDLTVKAVVK